MGLLKIAPSAQYGGYSQVDKEDPEELVHRRAQFLIHKALQQADSITKPSSFRIRFRRLSLRLGRRVKKLRKTVLVGSSAARPFSVYKRVISQLLRTWRLLSVTNGAAAAVPPAALLITTSSSSKSQ